MTRIALNLLGHQLAWWACVISARADAASIGIGVTLTVLALHLVYSKDRTFEAWTIPLAAAIGYAVDTAATLFGALDFPAGGHSLLPAPLWIAALWLAFATTINTSLTWLRHRRLAAVAVGAVSGPLAYAGGAFFDVVTLPNPMLSMAVLAVFWGATLPVLISIAARSASPRFTPVTSALASCAGDLA